MSQSRHVAFLMLALLWPISGLGQDAPRVGSERPGVAGPYARLPGAAATAPDWIDKDAPFDVSRLFAPMPRNRNAAPLYLDALSEFWAEMADCFPEGPERDRRRRAAEDRMNRYGELVILLRSDPSTVRPDRTDAVIAVYETGFRKLAEAQRRDRCVFETGLGAGAPLPHAQAARQVSRIASLRIRRLADRGDLDGATHEVETVLRLVRDLGPRGALLPHLIMSAITQVVGTDVSTTILAHPNLRIEHCDRLLKASLDHEARAGDGYTEALRAEYVISRVEVRNAARKQASASARTSPDVVARVVRELNTYYRTMLDLDGLPYAETIEKASALKMTTVDDPLSRMVEMLKPAMGAFVQATGRAVATVRATECLIVMRRWQLLHRGLPRALTVAGREAGLKAIPIDPYDGKPMRVTVVEGQSAVYSVGKDGHDDGGRKDSWFDTQPGDLIYRLPPLEPSRPPSPAGARKGR